MMGDFQQQKRKATMIGAMIVCVALLFGAGLILKSKGILGQSGNGPDNSGLTAKGSLPSDSALLAKGDRPDGLLEARVPRTMLPWE